MDQISGIATAAQASVGYCNSVLQTVRQEPPPVLVRLGPSSGNKFSIVLLGQVL